MFDEAGAVRLAQPLGEHGGCQGFVPWRLDHEPQARGAPWVPTRSTKQLTHRAVRRNRRGRGDARREAVAAVRAGELYLAAVALPAPDFGTRHGLSCRVA